MSFNGAHTDQSWQMPRSDWPVRFGGWSLAKDELSKVITEIAVFTWRRNMVQHLPCVSKYHFN